MYVNNVSFHLAADKKMTDSGSLTPGGLTAHKGKPAAGSNQPQQRGRAVQSDWETSASEQTNEHHDALLDNYTRQI
ncbi:hypothetical protein PBY51_011046 [Eleginops maclovinus]|uniref:Uncharacterized protein n=1 Tax=Eleginops maclovinus TaxID=56733 RepID=A0AAN7XBD3_ELEMC|nr:hypothetical protein PBY51_011046 [Eleginops maclovinus]